MSTYLVAGEGMSANTALTYGDAYNILAFKLKALFPADPPGQLDKIAKNALRDATRRSPKWVTLPGTNITVLSQSR